jgi:hypothetical protein
MTSTRGLSNTASYSEGPGFNSIRKSVIMAGVFSQSLEANGMVVAP